MAAVQGREGRAARGREGERFRVAGGIALDAGSVWLCVQKQPAFRLGAEERMLGAARWVRGDRAGLDGVVEEVIVGLHMSEMLLYVY